MGNFIETTKKLKELKAFYTRIQCKGRNFMRDLKAGKLLVENATPLCVQIEEEDMMKLAI